jgi:hypothetical protein
MTITFCEKWIRNEKKCLNELDSAAAHERNRSRQYYSVVLGSKTRPTHVVFLSGTWIKVSFFDEDMREYLNYDFKEVKRGMLFLVTAIHRQYEGQSEKVARAKHFRFQPDGEILMEERDFVTGTATMKRATFDPSANWEHYPEFGAYERLCKYQRECINVNSQKAVGS